MADKQTDAAQDLRRLRQIAALLMQARRQQQQLLAERAEIVARRHAAGTGYAALARACGVTQSILARQAKHPSKPKP